MRIIHAHKYFYMRAGAERYMLGLMRMQEERGHQVVPFSMHYSKNIQTPWSDFFVSEMKTESGIKKGFSSIYQAKRSYWSSEAERKMENLIDAFGPDIVHTHNLYTHLSPSPLRACKKKGVPVVMSVHDYALVSANYALWTGEEVLDPRATILETAQTRFIKGSFLATYVSSCIQKWQQRKQMYDQYIDLYFANSEFTKQIMVTCGFDSEKIEIAYPFSEFDAMTATKQDKGFVLFVGRLEKYKGVQTLIEAMRSYPNVVLKIVGTGEYEQELRSLARGMKNVSFVGFVKGNPLAELMAQARVVVVPSIWNEPFGMVAVEAMSVGTPVIVSDRGGLVEIVEQGLSGHVFKPGDVDDLARSLFEFIHDPIYSREMGKIGRQRALEISDREEFAENILGSYRQLID